jgi:predicted enzyme related to lactoylglutathione lyase
MIGAMMIGAAGPASAPHSTDPRQEAPMPGPGTAYWNELSTDHLDAAKAFYARLLGWSYDTVPMPDGPYVVAKAGEEMTAGLMAIPMAGMASQWVPYFAVADIDATLAEVEAAGGKAMTPITEVAGVGRLFWATDPGGAMVAFMTPADAPGGG